MAGRPRKPSNVLVMNGAFKKNPQRAAARANEPESDGDIGEPPEFLGAEVAACWSEIVGLCHEGTLGRADRLIVEHAAQLLSQLRGSKWACDPKVYIRYEACLGKLGLTPADRSKVSGVKKTDGARDPLDEFGT